MASKRRKKAGADGDVRAADGDREVVDARVRRIIGIDGEGYDTPDGRHVYVYLAAVDQNNTTVAEAFDPSGLSHEACVRMVLSLPKDSLKFGFMFSYDTTKIIEDLPLADRYYLMRPSLRDERSCLACKTTFKERYPLCPECGSDEIRSYTRKVRYRGRTYDFFNGSLTVGENKRSTKVWDCFRFFGSAFVKALEDWKIGEPEQIERIADMKGKRGALELETPEQIKNYCKEECWLLACMMEKVRDAHDEAGIELKRFDGAGSTATALLRANNVTAYKGPPFRQLPPGLAHAIASAFFGGRFEDSMVGIAYEPVHGFDISSAYPYALTFMPCLACGRWKRIKRATLRVLKSAEVAVAKFRVKNVSAADRRRMPWGPLPCRDRKGSISYGVNFRGWAWGPELVAALEGWPDLVELDGEAWIYETRCDHKPFSFLPSAYLQRLKWGKEGPGKVMKLGINAGYGKTAQTLGEDPPFQSWVWAGMTTATTRALILRAISLAKDPWNVLTVATDGIYSLESLPLCPSWCEACAGLGQTPVNYLAPRATGTDVHPDPKKVSKPLGGWEHKSIPEGVFVVKPGLYYRLSVDADHLDEVRARGVGRKEVLKYRAALEEGFRQWDRENMKHAVEIESRRFYGAKHSIFARSRCEPCKKSWPGVPENLCPSCGEPGTGFETKLVENEEGRPAYGLWGPRKIQVGFDPHPKREREGIAKDGTYARLHLRDMEGIASRPYAVGQGVTTPEGEAVRRAREVDMEQPDFVG